MYEKENHPTAKEPRQPELALILDKLKDSVNRYEGIVYETKAKLQMIKKFDESVPIEENGKQIEPNSVTEEIGRLLHRLFILNELSQVNLNHLREII